MHQLQLHTYRDGCQHETTLLSAQATRASGIGREIEPEFGLKPSGLSCLTLHLSVVLSLALHSCSKCSSAFIGLRYPKGSAVNKSHATS